MTRPKRPAFCAKCGAELEYEGRTPYCACGLRESECECEASAAANPAALKVECPDGRHILCISEIERIRALEVDVAKERSLAEQATRARRDYQVTLAVARKMRDEAEAREREG